MIVHQGSKFEQQCWILLPNASLTCHQAKVLLGAVGVGMALISGGFAWAGAWPVLPFAGIELGLLGWGLSWSLRQSAGREVITVNPVAIRIERTANRGRVCYEFHRAWVRIDWQKPKTLGEPSRLLLGSHGRRVEIGAFLIEEEKAALLKSLRQVLSSSS
ncbi:MAG: DUF2244 domain-containing protein [Methylohalobius sp.]|nr:DUF2244 domain-containing protein [Methylohalobius sp.]